MTTEPKSLEEEARAILKPIPEDSLSKLNNNQLWTVYMALYYHTNLVEPLKSATAELAKRVHEIGRQKYKWVKV